MQRAPSAAMRRDDGENKRPPPPDIDVEASHKEQRAKMMAAAKEQEEKERLERKRRREASEADSAATVNAELERKRKQEALVNQLEFTSGQALGFNDEFKQLSMADESHLEVARIAGAAKQLAAKEAEERARFEAEQAAAEVDRKQKAASFLQAAIEAKGKEAARKQARPGVRLAVKKASDEPTAGNQQSDSAPDSKAAETLEKASPPPKSTPESGKTGLGLGGYDSEDESESE